MGINENTEDYLGLELDLLEMWDKLGVEEIYKYKHRVNIYREDENLARIELIYDLTHGLLFTDLDDIANYSDAYPDECKLVVKEMIESRVNNNHK